MAGAVDQLDNPAGLIRAGFTALGPKQRRAAQFILDSEAAVAFLSANELAERVGVDPATVVRLCQRLGYRGYPHLQDAVRRRLPRYPTFVERVERGSGPASAGTLLSRSFAQDRQNLARAAESLDPVAFERLVEAVLTARQTVLAGGGVARPVVLYLASSLRMMGFDVRDTTAGSTALAQELALLTDEDLFLAVGFYRYLRETVEALDAARALGVRRAVITDSPVSPMVALADMALFVPVESTSHRISLVASMALANALLAVLATRARDRVAAALRRVNDQYHRAHLVIYD